jgi:N-acetylneuraminic acid mutarotase
MRNALRAWLVLGAACVMLTTPAACTQAPQLTRTTPSPSASAATTPPSVSGGWSGAGDLSTARGWQIVGVQLQGGRVLVTGASIDGPTGKVDIYDPGSGWSVGPKLSSDLSGAVAAPLPGGRALIAGGVPYFGPTDSPNLIPLATAMTYNPATGTWTYVPNMGVARSDATATALPDGRVLVAGGYNGQLIQLTNPPRQGMQIVPLASSQFFNPTSSAWTTGPALTHGRFGHSAVALKGGRVLVVGGADQRDPLRLLDSAELFDPATARWLSAGSIGAPRTQFTVTALMDGRALLAGGLATDGSTVLRSTLLYDPAKNLWSPGPELADERTGHAAAALADGRVLVTGGADQVGRLASSELLDPSANSWSATGALATARSNHLAISLPNGRILVIGGSGSSDPLASSELFDPSAKGMPAAARVPAGPGHWQLAAAKPIPADASTDSVQLLPDGRVLMLPARDHFDFDAQVYDPRLDAWTTPFSRKGPPCNACGIGSPSPPAFIATPLANSKLLLLTIDPQQIIAGKAEVIDLNTGKAAAAASPGKIGYARLYLLPDGRVWMIADTRALLFDPIADRWTATSNVPPGLGIQTVTAVPGTRVLVGGSGKAMVYDPATGGWADAGSFPNTATGSSATGLASWSGYSATRLHSGDVLLAGGSVLMGATPAGAPIYAATTRVVRWDHSTGLLTPAESMPVASSNHSTAVLADGRVLLVGGVDAVGLHTSPDPVARAEIYDPATRSWSPAAPLPGARWNAIAVALADGRVFLVGGNGMWLGWLVQSSGLPSLLFTPQS